MLACFTTLFLNGLRTEGTKMQNPLYDPILIVQNINNEKGISYCDYRNAIPTTLCLIPYPNKFLHTPRKVQCTSEGRHEILTIQNG